MNKPNFEYLDKRVQDIVETRKKINELQKKIDIGGPKNTHDRALTQQRNKQCLKDGLSTVQLKIVS